MIMMARKVRRMGVLGCYLVACACSGAQAELCRYFEHQKLVAPNAQESENLGLAVATDGERIAAGAPQRDFATFNDGAVLVFRRSDAGTPSDPADDQWVFEAELNPWDGLAAQMGRRVALGGDRVVAGSHGSGDADGGDPTCVSGAAYVFRYADGQWWGEQKLLASDMACGHRFGQSVSIAGDWIAVGALNTNDDVLPETGAAYLFRLDDNGTPEPTDDLWIEQIKVTSPAGDPEDRFGRSVAVGDSRVVVGAPSKDYPGSDTDPGSAYVYRRDGNGTPGDLSDDLWVYEDALMSSDGEPGDNFGYSLGISDDRIIVGALEDTDIARRCGSAYVFRHDDHGTPSDETDDFWYQEAKLVASDAVTWAGAGNAVAIRGTLAVVGAHDDSNMLDIGAGSAYVYRYVGGQWVQEQKLLASDGEFTHEFGSAVATDGVWVVTGASCDDQMSYNAGAVYTHLVVDDCNGNCIPDEEDLVGGFSDDYDANGIPDECEDCNANGVADICDLDCGVGSCAGDPNGCGTSPDCNANAIPDECEENDCNANGVPDDCDLASGSSPDCNANGVPDECDWDCNSDGIPDDCAENCTLDCECYDGSVCTQDYCEEGACVNTECTYGDVYPDGAITVSDIFAILNAFGAYSPGDPGLNGFDIQPCEGDGDVNIFDLFAVLNAFSGEDPCCNGLP